MALPEKEKKHLKEHIVQILTVGLRFFFFLSFF